MLGQAAIVVTVPAVSCTLGALADADCLTDATRSDAPTWLIGLDYDPVRDVLLYAKYARGYRQGAVSYNAPPPFQTVGPEKVDSYEIGGKASWRGAVPGRLNVAAFYNRLSDQQIQVQLASSTNRATTTTTNLNAGARTSPAPRSTPH